MVQGTDVEIGGQGYALLAGGYRRIGEGVAASAATGRVAVGAFGGGQRQAVPDAGTNDRSWDALGVGPAAGGEGVEPWPAEAPHADASILANPSAEVRAHGLVSGNHAYVGIGRYLYRSVALTATAWSDLARIADVGAGNAIGGLCHLGDDLLLLRGAGQDIQRWNTATSSLAIWRTGERATVGIGYQGQLLSTPGGTAKEELRLSLVKHNGAAATDKRWLDSEVVAMGLFGGKAAIATRRSLYLMGGQPDPGQPDDPGISGDQSKPTLWRGDPEPIFSHGGWTAEDDFRFLLAFEGRLYTWLGGRVVSWDGVAASGWRQEALEGAVCWGACVTAGRLVVATTARSGEGEVWAWDGRGWWRIGLAAAGSAAKLWPAALAGAGDRDLLVFRGDSASYELHRLVWRSASVNTYAAAGQWVSSLLDAGQRGAVKTWRRVGAGFAWPAARGNAASTDPVTLTLEYSADGGASWTTAATTTVSNGNARTIDLEGAIASGAVRSRWLQLRVTWSGVQDWAPVLTGVWADYALVPAGAPRRRWEVKVRCSDLAVGRDGSAPSRSGRAVAADLWAAWESGTGLAFRDVDYDATGQSFSVRVAAIREEVPRAADAGRWGESAVALELVEA